MGIKKKIAIGLIVLIVIIQFFRIDKTNPEVDPSKDFITMVNTPQEIENILRTSCYDCHSNETVYPWYSNVAPVSWWIKDHIDHARGHLNFSQWGDYESDEKEHKLEEIDEEVGEGKMPLKSYLIAHSDARLNEQQRKQLIDWVKSLQH